MAIKAVRAMGVILTRAILAIRRRAFPHEACAVQTADIHCAFRTVGLFVRTSIRVAPTAFAFLVDVAIDRRIFLVGTIFVCITILA
jgi:hypothetical protein